LKESTFGDYTDYKVDKQKIIERTEDLNNFAKLLEENGVKVVRPDELNAFKSFKTPHFSGFLTPVSNPRDKVIVIGNKIIETSALCSKRYFENQLLYKLFLEYFNK
jgi:glycine amidinotransferase